MKNTNYINEKNRQFEITELLKTRFGLTADVGYANAEEKSRIITVTYDGQNFKTAKLYFESSDEEIIEVFQTRLFSNKWGEEYTINPNTAVLKAIFEQYNFSDYGYVINQNDICYIKHDEDGTCSIEKIFNTEDMRGISFEVDVYNDYDPCCFTIKTKNGNFLFSGSGAKKTE
jgi:hypothetical protein